MSQTRIQTSSTGASSGGTPGGADTDIQFNDGGVFGGESSFTFNKTDITMTLTFDSDGSLDSTNDTISVLDNAGEYVHRLGEGSIIRLGYQAGGTVSNDKSTICIGYAAGQDIATATQTRSIYIGARAGEDHSSGNNTRNVYVGHQAGRYNNPTAANTGRNVCIGDGAGLGNSGGTSGYSQCVFIGELAGADTLTGNDNFGLGRNAARGISTGVQNIGIGTAALWTDTLTGSNNIAMGKNTMGNQNATSANENVVIGNISGGNIISGASNTFIGHGNGGTLETGDGNILIGYDLDVAATTTSDYVSIGDLIRGDISSNFVYMGMPTSEPTIQNNTYTAWLDDTNYTAQDVLTFTTQDNASANLDFLGVSPPTGSGTVVYQYDHGTGTFAWITTPSGGSGTPGGSDKDVQFNDGGSFNGESVFEYDKTTNQLAIGVGSTLASSATKLIVDGGTGFTGANLIQVDNNGTTRFVVESDGTVQSLPSAGASGVGSSIAYYSEAQYALRADAWGTNPGETGEINFRSLNGLNWVGLKAPDTISTNVVWTLPNTDSTGIQAMVSDGSGNLGWQDAGTVSSITAGDGMDFTTITSTGTITMGTPSSVTATSTNSVTTTSHTHEVSGLTTSEFASANVSQWTNDANYLTTASNGLTKSTTNIKWGGVLVDANTFVLPTTANTEAVNFGFTSIELGSFNVYSQNIILSSANGIQVQSGTELQFIETGGGGNYVAFDAPASITSDVTWTLPNADASGAFISDGAGTMSISPVMLDTVESVVIYVSKTGSDSNAGTSKGLPKLTIAAAITAASSGDDVVILDGVYDEKELGKDGVNIRFEGNARIVATGMATNGVFDDLGVSMSFDIYNADVKCSGTGGSFIDIANSGSTIRSINTRRIDTAATITRNAGTILIEGGVIECQTGFDHTATTADTTVQGSYVEYTTDLTDVSGGKMKLTNVHAKAMSNTCITFVADTGNSTHWVKGLYHEVGSGFTLDAYADSPNPGDKFYIIDCTFDQGPNATSNIPDEWDVGDIDFINTFRIVNGVRTAMELTTSTASTFMDPLADFQTITGTTDTLTAADADKVNFYTNASGCTVTIPANGTVSFPQGTRIKLMAAPGSGDLTISGAVGVTLSKQSSSASPVIKSKLTAVTIRKFAVNTWIIEQPNTGPMPIPNNSYVFYSEPAPLAGLYFNNSTANIEARDTAGTAQIKLNAVSGALDAKSYLVNGTAGVTGTMSIGGQVQMVNGIVTAFT